MGVWPLLLVAVVLLLGLIGVLVPGVPGPWLVWAAVLWWALQNPGTSLAWVVLGGATAVLLAAQALRWQLTPRRRKEGLITSRLAVSAGFGALIGFMVLPVIGALPGFLGGVLAAERLRLGSLGEARAATRAVMRSGGWSVLTELFACLLITAAWIGSVAWG